MNGKHTLFIVGAAGYIGAMLCDQFSKLNNVGKIVALDKEDMPRSLLKNKKIEWITANMSDDSWQEQVRAQNPDIVIHTAWQIRAMYGQSKRQWHWNVDGSNKVFDLALSLPSVKKLIYFSTASSYGACKDNSFEHLFTEEEGFRDDNYIYAHEKKETEENLKTKYDQAKKEGNVVPQVSIVRPAAVTGPRGRYVRIRFGLQSALSGNLEGGFVNKIVTTLTSWVPATKGWARQFIHEDDVKDIVEKFSFEDMPWEYEVFNITPVSKPVFAPDMAEAVGKKVLPIHPWMVRTAFFFFWHITRGKIPTCPGSWRFYSYPVLMSGEKLAKVYMCKYASNDAFQYTNGRYENFVPEEKRRTKFQTI